MGHPDITPAERAAHERAEHMLVTEFADHLVEYLRSLPNVADVQPVGDGVFGVTLTSPGGREIGISLVIHATQ